MNRNGTGPSTETYSRERLRDLFNRKALAGERHRRALARVLDLSDTEATALVYLARSGHLTPGQLGELLSLTSGGVTALTHRLERSGHVTREPHPSDGRSSVLSASPAILRSAEECFAPLVADMDDAAAALSAQERTIVGRFLEDVAALSERHAEELAASAEERERAQPSGAPSPGLWA